MARFLSNKHNWQRTTRRPMIDNRITDFSAVSSIGDNSPYRVVTNGDVRTYVPSVLNTMVYAGCDSVFAEHIANKLRYNTTTNKFEAP